MNTIPNTQAITTAKNIFQSGLNRASEALVVITGQSVQLQAIKLQATQGANAQAVLPQFTEQVQVLSTQLKGQLQGNSYMFITQQQSVKLKQMLAHINGFEQQGFEFLKEIDNMLAAAIISVIANKLSVAIYGDVPHHHCLQGNELHHWWANKQTIENCPPSQEVLLVVTSSLQVGQNETIDFFFVWCLQQQALQYFERITT